MADFTNYTGIDTMQGLASAVNNDVGGILFTGGIIAFYIIILMYLYRSSEANGYDFGAPFTAASWVTFLVSAIFWFANLLPTPMPLLFLLFSAFGTIYLYASRR